MRLLLVIFLSLLANMVAAQLVSVTGVVRDSQTGNALPSVTLTVSRDTLSSVSDGWKGVSVSDADGHFSASVPQGSFLRFSFVGYVPCVIRVDRRGFSGLDVKLLPESAELDNVDVVARRRAEFQSIDASVAANVVDVSGGIESVVKSQMGVSSNSELSSQYRVRGGNFDENMVYVNNIEVYRPFLIRSGEQEGLSFVNPDMVESVDFSSGGFDASYADKMSSVLDVKYKKPHDVGGGVRVSLLGASAYFEGCAAQGRYTHITGLRYKTNRYMLGSLDTKGDYNPTFFDVQSFHTFMFGDRVRADVLAYYAGNKYEFKPEDRKTTFGTLADAKTFTIYFEGEEADYYNTGLLAGSLSWAPSADHSFSLNASMYRSKEQENYDILGEYWLQQAQSDETNIGVGGYMEHARNELFSKVCGLALRGKDRFGINSITWEGRLQRELFDDYVNEWQYVDSAGYLASPSDGVIEFDRYVLADNRLSSKRFMAFLMDKMSFAVDGGSVNIGAGLRVSYWDENDECVVSPRLSADYVRGRWTFRVSGGCYSQTPFFRELRRDDGSLNHDVKAQRSWQVVAGADLYFTASQRPFKFTVEAYYKGMSQLNPYSIDNVRVRYMADNCAKGYVAGIDAKINGELVDGVESWACLSLMKTAEDVENDGHGYIPRPSDQRFSLSMFFQDHMPSNKSVGATLNFYVSSGLPFGPPSCERYMATNRMPGYKRIDLGLFKDFAKNPDGSARWHKVKAMRLGFEVFNLFDFANTISYFWVSEVNGGKYAVPNYLTSRRLNLKFSVDF